MFKKLISKFKDRDPQVARIILDSDAPIGDGGVLTETVGIRIYDGTIAAFSKVGENYPANSSYTFSTDEDFQDQITLEFHINSQSMTNQESFLGTVRIRGYKLEKAREPLVRVYYELSDNQIAIWATNEKHSSELSLTLLKNIEGSSVH